MKKLSFLAAILMIVANACSNQKQATEEAVVNVLSIDEIFNRALVLVDSLVTFEGTCTHTCKHGARKMFVVGSAPEHLIRVEACELGSFDPAVIHQPVTVTGYLREQRIDEQYLASWEASLADAPEVESGEASCETENAAHGISANSALEKIAQYRQMIADRDENEGLPYLSFYYVDATDYSIQDK